MIILINMNSHVVRNCKNFDIRDSTLMSTPQPINFRTQGVLDSTNVQAKHIKKTSEPIRNTY
jgi:hypothetical protein